MEAWPQHDLGGSQHGAGRGHGFTGSSSQSSPAASHTDDKAYKIVASPSPNQAGGGRVPERELVESRSGGKERRKGDGTSVATRHPKTRASKAGMLWQTEARECSEKAQLLPTSGPEGCTLAAGSLESISPILRLICLEALSLMELTR